MIKVGILGATGYAGIEVVRLLTAHPEAEIVRVVSQSFVGQKISDVYQNLKGISDLCCTALDIDDIAGSCDLVFTASDIMTRSSMKSGMENLTRRPRF